MDNVDKNYEEILSKNKELWDYIDRLSVLEESKNRGKVISEVGERQQRRKLKELRTQVKEGLWFAESYGLTLDSASFNDQRGVSHTLAFKDDRDRKPFKDIPQGEKDKIKQILFIQGKFSIGEAAYHDCPWHQ